MRVSTKWRMLAAVAVGCGLALTFSASAQASHADSSAVAHAKAVPGLAPDGGTGNEPYFDQAGRAIPNPNAAAAKERASNARSAQPNTELFGCTPVSGRDNPHYSYPDVSGHGWWDKGTCTANTAHVINCLYEYYTDGSYVLKACSEKKQVYAGGGRANRTVARSTCEDYQYTTWRNHVDVDVDGQVDTSEVPYNQANVYCRVY